MQIAIVCAGSRGDVQPYVALAVGLQEAGYRVRVVTHENFEPLVRAHRLDFCPVRGNPRALMDHALARKVMGSGQNLIRFTRNLHAMFRALMDTFLEDCQRGCQGAQAIIFSTLGFPAFHIAEAMSVPAFAAFLQPQTRTSAFPAPFVSAPRWLRKVGPFNRLTYVFMELLTWQLMRQEINRWRVETLGLAPLPRSGPYRRMYRGKMPVLYGFSQHVVPRPRDWPETMHVTGYWFLDTAEGWTPPQDLVAFLEAGPPPVYIGFGSMRGEDPVKTARIAIEALRLSGQRGVLLTGWGGLHPDEVPESVFVVEEVPHDWLFPRVAAVVHHGGAGTTAAGLRAGRPTVVVPFIVDQFFWGERVQALGVGPTPIPHRRLTAERLAAAIEQAVRDEAMRARAEALGARLQAEDGVREAVAILNRYLSRVPSRALLADKTLGHTGENTSSASV